MKYEIVFHVNNSIINCPTQYPHQVRWGVGKEQSIQKCMFVFQY